jgi:hypothetical protein
VKKTTCILENLPPQERAVVKTFDPFLRWQGFSWAISRVVKKRVWGCVMGNCRQGYTVVYKNRSGQERVTLGLYHHFETGKWTSRASTLKHFEMTVGLKVLVQGFQICLRIFLILNANVESFKGTVRRKLMWVKWYQSIDLHLPLNRWYFIFLN